MMKSSELVAKVVDIAKHYKTLYVMGCFGAPLTDTNKSRYIKFQSTRPVRGATMLSELQLLIAKISIHAPLAGRDTNKGANQNERHPIC